MTLNECYKLADNLQMDLQRQGNSIIGERHATVMFGDLALNSTVRVVASWTSKEGDGMVLVETFGDVGLLMGVDGNLVHCAIVDLSKLAKRGENFFTKNKCKTIKTAETLVMDATVARFVRKKVEPWQPAAL